MKNKKQKIKKGFITLITVILVSAVTLTITFSFLLLGIGSVQTSESIEDSAKAKALHDACVYQALENIRANWSYTGSGNLSLGDGSCSFTVTESGGGGSGGGNVLSLRFEDAPGSTTITDSSGNNRNFDCTGGACPTLGTPGQCGNAADFDGTDDILEDADGEAYINGLSAFTLSVWVQSDLTNIDKGIFHTIQPNGNDDVLTIRYDSAGAYGGGTQVIKAGVTVSGNVQQTESQSNVQTTNWQHLLMTWTSGDDIEFYINGVPDVPTFKGALQSGLISGANTVLVGTGANQFDTGVGPWNGRIDNLDIWDRVLSNSEINQLFTSCSLSNDPVKTIEATATVNSVTRKVRVTTSQLQPMIRIATWDEVADF